MEPFEFTLDMTPAGAPLTKIRCSEGDIKRPYVAKLKYCGSDYTIPEGSTVELHALKPDENIYIHAATWNGNLVYFETETQLSVVAGDVLCEIVLVGTDGSQMGTWNFILTVEPNPLISGVSSDSQITWIAEAQTAASNAKASETAADESATAASGSKTAAANSATNAAASAGAALSAKQAAETAQGKAEKARDDAEGHADQTAQDAQEVADDKQAVVDLKDDVVEIKDGIVTDEQNRQTAEQARVARDLKWSSIDVEVETLNPDDEATAELVQTENSSKFEFGIPKGDKGDKGDTGEVTAAQMNAAIEEAIDPVGSQLADVAKFASPASLWRTVTGNPATCYPVPESPLYPKVSLVATQSGSGDPSPENVRPIIPAVTSGGKVKVNRTGKNLLPRKTTYVASTVDGITFTPLSDGGFSVVGTATANASFGILGSWASNVPLFTVQPGTYRFAPNVGGITLECYGRKNGAGRWTEYFGPSAVGTATIDFAVEVSFAHLVVKSGKTANTVAYPQLELGSVATPYEPYTGDTYEFTAPQDLYGLPGAETYVDWEKGELTSWTRRLNAADLSGNITLHSTNEHGIANYVILLDDSGIGASAGTGVGTCNVLPKQTTNIATTTTIGVLMANSSTFYIRLFAADAPTVADALAWLSAHGFEFVYPLATPIRTPLTDLPAIHALPQLDRYTPRQNVLTVDKGALTVGYAKSPIRESDELQAAIAALA